MPSMKFRNMRKQDKFGGKTPQSLNYDGVGANSNAKSSHGAKLNQHGAILDDGGLHLNKMMSI